MMLVLLFFGLVAQAHPQGAGDSSIVLVVNPSVQEQALTTRELRRILSGKVRRWPNGKAVTIVLPPRGSTAMGWLSRTALGMPESTYRRVVLERAFRGSIVSPYLADSIENAHWATSKTAGAISALPADQAGDLPRIDFGDGP